MNIRWSITAFVALALLGVPAYAQPQVATSMEVLPFGVDLDQVMVTPDYFAKTGAVSFYGFVEYSGESGGWFTNHSATWLPKGSWLGLRAEVGINDAGSSGSALGVTLAPTVPGFLYLKVSPQAVFGNYEREFEVNTAWKTKPFAAFGGELWTEGFIRAFRDAGSSYGQPQLWWRSGKDSAWHFGAEVEVAGSSRTVRFGVRRVF